jgi:hypothetical protein
MTATDSAEPGSQSSLSRHAEVNGMTALIRGSMPPQSRIDVVVRGAESRLPEPHQVAHLGGRGEGHRWRLPLPSEADGLERREGLPYRVRHHRL